MADIVDILFAPQVRAIQPAFVDIYKVTYDTAPSPEKVYFTGRREGQAIWYDKYSGDTFQSGVTYYEKCTKVYFNLGFLDVNDISYILFTLIDPNKTSSWGNSSMISASKSPARYLASPFLAKQEQGQTPDSQKIYYTYNSESKKYTKVGKLSTFATGQTYYYFNQDPDTEEFYFYLNLDESDISELSRNQFYQMQLYFSNVPSSAFAGGAKIDIGWLETYKNNISEPSQATLIRSVNTPQINFTDTQTKVQGQISHDKYDWTNLSGTISGEKESISMCYCKVYNQSKTSLLFTTEVFAGSGNAFSVDLNPSFFKEGEFYPVEFYYTTAYGYSGVSNVTFLYAAPSRGNTVPTFTLSSCESDGSITLTASSGRFSGGKVQRMSNLCPNQWVTIFSNLTGVKEWTDYTIESGVKYKYRIVSEDLGTLLWEGKDGNYFKAPVFENIFLSDQNGMTAFFFNTNITSVKWVTQESITNTLGGKYPLIRKNGETKYKQFNLTGAIDCGLYTSTSVVDSLQRASNSYGITFDDIGTGSLYLKESLANSFINGVSGMNPYFVEKKIRESIMDLLTNSKPKLFRSFEEGNIIVCLSNISFTPNKTLGRHIYDFSATITELCEYNSENLIKYNLNPSSYVHITKNFLG